MKEKEEEEEEDIVFREKSPWEGDDCINPDCTNKSVIEAVLRSVNGTARCCKEEKCKQKAKEHVELIYLNKRKACP